MVKSGVNLRMNRTVNTKNTPYLVIVESPFKCKKIEKILGFQYKCIASNGHFREISRINTKEKEKWYEPEFEIISSKQKHVENMRKIISYFDTCPENIFIGTDDDREGEAIAWHICKTFGLPIERVHRILFHEITETAIQEAIQHPLKIRMNIVFSQHARQVLDRLVGFNISPLLTKRMGEPNHLSAGRCQTPALRLIYDREQIISKDNKEDYLTNPMYTINGYFFSPKTHATAVSFPLKFTLPKKRTKDECILFLEKSREFSHELRWEKTQQKKISAPLPLNTSALLQSANVLFQLSSNETMDYCQQLYQAGYITYMRTESVVYSKTFISKVNKYITDTFSLEYIGNMEERLETQSPNHCPHEAIRVTDIYCKEVFWLGMESENKRQQEQRQKLYHFIWKRSIESCMSDYVYNQTIVKITSPDEDCYEYVLDIPVFLGWNVLEKENAWREEQTKQNGLWLFLQSAKFPIKCMKIEGEMYLSERKSRYTEAALIRDLEKYGIGRPSTFSIILQCIQERNYVLKKNIEGETISCMNIVLEQRQIIYVKKERTIGMEKNRFVLQDLGKRVVEALIPTFEDLFGYDYTKNMELELDKVSDGKLEDWRSICRECDRTIVRNAKQWKREMKQIYSIDEQHELLFIKTGPIIRIRKDTGDVAYKRIKPGIRIDFEKLRNKEYNLEELLEIPKEMLGEYEGHPLFLKNGQYGLYVTWGDKKENISSIQKKPNEIQLTDILEYLSTTTKKNGKLQKQIIRVLNERISIRKSKYGNYIHYSLPSKDDKGKDTQFYNIQLFPGNYLNCETSELLIWLENTYGII